MDSNPLLGMLVEMGFPEAKALRALRATGNADVAAALDWISAHGDDDTAGAATDASAQDTMKLALTEEERLEQEAKAKERIAQRRREREEEERKTELEREKARRTQGKELLDAKDKAAMAEMQKLAEERKRDKEEDRRAREKTKALIEQDRQARFAEQNKDKEIAPVPPTPFSTPNNSSASLVSASGQTRIQIRMFDGKPLVHSFGVGEPLGAVRLYAEMNRQDGQTGPFGLMTNFPTREFTDDDMSAPLSALGLIPSATIIATRKLPA